MMADPENTTLLNHRRGLQLILAICGMLFVAGLIVLPFRTAIRLIGLGAIVAIPYGISLAKLDARHGPAPIFIVLIPGLMFVREIGDKSHDFLKIMLYSAATMLIAIPVMKLVRRIWPNASKGSETSANQSVQA